MFDVLTIIMTAIIWIVTIVIPIVVSYLFVVLSGTIVFSCYVAIVLFITISAAADYASITNVINSRLLLRDAAERGTRARARAG